MIWILLFIGLFPWILLETILWFWLLFIKPIRIKPGIFKTFTKYELIKGKNNYYSILIIGYILWGFILEFIFVK